MCVPHTLRTILRILVPLTIGLGLFPLAYLYLFT